MEMIKVITQRSTQELSAAETPRRKIGPRGIMKSFHRERCLVDAVTAFTSTAVGKRGLPWPTVLRRHAQTCPASVQP